MTPTLPRAIVLSFLLWLTGCTQLNRVDSGVSGDAGADAGQGHDSGPVPDAGADSGRPDAGIRQLTVSGGFSTMGGVISGGAIVVVSGGFEFGEVACSPSGDLCIRGGLAP